MKVGLSGKKFITGTRECKENPVSCHNLLTKLLVPIPLTKTNGVFLKLLLPGNGLGTVSLCVPANNKRLSWLVIFVLKTLQESPGVRQLEQS